MYFSATPIVGNHTCTGISANLLARFFTFEITNTFQWAPTASDFRRASPYTSGILYLPGVGNVEVNLTDFSGNQYMTVRTVIEALTGNVTYFLENSVGAIVASYTCNVSANVPVGNTLLNSQGVANGISNVLGGAASAVIGAATGNLGMIAGGTVNALSGAAGAALAANQKMSTVSGNTGSWGAAACPKIMLTVFTSSTENPNDSDYIATLGRPVGEMHNISYHSGYVQTMDAHFDGAGTLTEKEQIETYLNSGIYYE